MGSRQTWRRLGVELLEDRAVPALFITGTAGPDTIVFDFDKVVVGGVTTMIPPAENFVQLDASGGGDMILVEGVISGRVINMNTGLGDDFVFLTPSSHNLNNIRGPVAVGGAGGFDRLILDDRSWGGGDTYTLTFTSAQAADRPGFLAVYASVEFLQLAAGTGNDHVRVESAAPGTAYSVNGGPGWDILQYLVGSDTDWHLTGPNQGTITGWGSFASVENLGSGAGNDTFYFHPGSGVSGLIDGGAGIDGLNYTGSFPGAFATIPSGPATATGGVMNFEWWVP